MFASAVLPFQITAAIFAVLWVVGALLLKPRQIAWLSIATVLLFIPFCIGVTVIVDSVRYGRFQYKTAAEIPQDGYIELPPAATNITLYRNASGHWGRFSIDTPTLQLWVEERRSLRPDLNKLQQTDEGKSGTVAMQHPEMIQIAKSIFDNRFPGTGWSYDPSMIEFHVSTSKRGGGYTLYHIRETGDTYLRAAYW